MDISQFFLDELTALAKTSPRLRQNYDLRNSAEDLSQRALNAMEPGTVVPIHRHQKSSETVVCLRGRLKEFFFDDQGHLTQEYVLAPNSTTIGLNIPAGQWHTVEVLESGTIILECKDGKYEPLGEEDILTI